MRGVNEEQVLLEESNTCQLLIVRHALNPFSMPNGEEDDSIYNHYSLIPKGTLTLTENSPVSFSSSWYVDQIVHSNLGLVKHDRMYQLLVFLSVAIPIIANPTETNNKQQDKIGFVSHNVNEISFLLYNDPR